MRLIEWAFIWHRRGILRLVVQTLMIEKVCYKDIAPYRIRFD